MQFDGSKLRAARKAAGLSRAELAVEAKVGFNTVGRAERGDIKGIGVDKIAQLATALSLDPGTLFTENGAAA